MSARTPRTGPHRAYCKSCDFSKRYPNHADAASHQRRRPCPECDRMLAVAPARVATDGGTKSGIKRFHALGASNAYHHTCKETDTQTFAVPDTNGRLRCSDCGAFCETSGGETHVEPFPIPYSGREVDTGTDNDVRTDGGETHREILDETPTFEVTVDDGRVSVDIDGDGPVEMTPGTACGFAREIASKAADADRDARADGGHVRTSDADLAAHDHANELEAALDHLLEAVRRADERSVHESTVARLRLSVSGARLAFHARTADERSVGLLDAHVHLGAVVDDLDDECVDHPVRHALQLLAGHEDGGAR